LYRFTIHPYAILQRLRSRSLLVNWFSYAGDVTVSCAATNVRSTAVLPVSHTATRIRCRSHSVLRFRSCRRTFDGCCVYAPRSSFVSFLRTLLWFVLFCWCGSLAAYLRCVVYERFSFVFLDGCGHLTAGCVYRTTRFGGRTAVSRLTPGLIPRFCRL